MRLPWEQNCERWYREPIEAYVGCLRENSRRTSRVAMGLAVLSVACSVLSVLIRVLS